MAKVSVVDIQHKSFKKSLQGYDRAEVDLFLDEIIESLEDEAQARAALEAEVSDLRERISHFKAMEDSLQSTLLLAQRTADEVKATAHQKAELFLEEARVMAERETGAIDSRISDARREYQHALELAEKAKSELRSMLVMYMNLLDKQMPMHMAQAGFQQPSAAPVAMVAQTTPTVTSTSQMANQPVVTVSGVDVSATPTL
jgi:cell division initiation protein